MPTEYLTRRNAVLEAIRAQRRELKHLWVQKGNDKLLQPILQEARENGVKIQTADKAHLSKLAQDNRHQGVVLECGLYQYSDIPTMIEMAHEQGEYPLLLLLDLVHGPQNIGALLRTAEICGVHGVIVQDRRAPEITPAVVQYSVGAAEHLHIAQVTNLTHTMNELKDQDIWLAGMDMDEEAKTIGEVDLNMPLGIIVGNEGSGLRQRVKKNCDLIIRLPMRGQVESLNASVAGSVFIYFAWQARQFIGQ